MTTPSRTNNSGASDSSNASQGVQGDGESLRLSVVLGPCDAMRAELFVRVDACVEGGCEPLRLTGTLVGPHSSIATTLPATVRLVGMPAAVGMDASRVPRPAGVIASCHRLLGLRRLGVRGRSFWLDGRRWVPRGISCQTVSDGAVLMDGKSLREAAVAAVVVDPEEGMCQQADREGVAIVAVLVNAARQPLDRTRLAANIVGLAMHPSVVLAVVPREASCQQASQIAEAARGFKGTMLLGHAVSGLLPPPQTMILGVDYLVVALQAGEVPHPESSFVAGEAGGLRDACDHLQASLAAWGTSDGTRQLPWDWAGYLAS
ncbi:MAG: hypothetical protein NTY25_14215 [Planctomycetia bacterium]|nr:hypothetical protein [Planctomycetia bacterium]